jgi:hypothetical protein
MTPLRRVVGIGAIVFAALASALPAQAAPKVDGTFDNLAQKSYAGGSQPAALGNGWYVDGDIWVGSPEAAEPGSVVPSAANSARLSQTTCVPDNGCQRTAGNLRVVMRSTPGRAITVSLLVAPGNAGMNSEVGVYGFAQGQPNLADAPDTAGALEGAGVTQLGSKVSDGLRWRQVVWKLRVTSAYTLVEITPGAGAELWVDDISLRCGA